MPASQGWVIGVDLGGTRSRVARADVLGNVVAFGEAGPGNPVRVGISRASAAVATAIAEAFRGIPGPRQVAAACVGMAGRSHPSAPEMLREAFGATGVEAGRRILVDDGTIALDAAFGLGAGILVLAGTGSGAVARLGDTVVRVGGAGPVLGDEGSAHWCGLEMLRAAIRSIEGRGPRTTLLGIALAAAGIDDPRRLPWALTEGRLDVAGLFVGLRDAAEAGDGVAAGILAAAGRELAGLAVAAANLLAQRVAESTRSSPGIPPPAALPPGGEAQEIREAACGEGPREGVPSEAPGCGGAGEVPCSVPPESRTGLPSIVATTGSVGRERRIRDALAAALPASLGLGMHVEEAVVGAVRRAVASLGSMSVPPGW